MICFDSPKYFRWFEGDKVVDDLRSMADQAESENKLLSNKMQTILDFFHRIHTTINIEQQIACCMLSELINN